MADRPLDGDVVGFGGLDQGQQCVPCASEGSKRFVMCLQGWIERGAALPCSDREAVAVLSDGASQGGFDFPGWRFGAGQVVEGAACELAQGFVSAARGLEPVGSIATASGDGQECQCQQ